MNSERILFAQLMDYLPLKAFHRCVKRYKGDHKVLSFSCLDQFLCLAFAQLTFRESLRDIEACLRFAGPKLYHMGFRGRVSRNTLANANEKRDWRIYADFAMVLIQQARELYSWRSVRRQPEEHRLRSRRHDRRPLPLGVSLGQVPAQERRCEGERVIGPAGKHPRFYTHLPCKYTRSEGPGFDGL